ncbi:XRE family transcriptional regulator [Hominisplanchenecus murintestinalis]|uniref:XRE family transcriptional regulator n=1 Tax=Hominisplanchenecus murintestinalis TaxID=2941517 RepID=A0AC61QVV9_9FIRM|nr:helix-turn-helix domain-containing protein [Hominisplanchenecus murintestinalis]TGX96839.1 XRE family transcriptional regulator [Hominisplanchenecus murintestinalis]
MYNTQDIASRIKSLLKSRRQNTKDMLSSLGMGINSISEFAKGKQMSCISLAKIADYLDCSVDYLLGRTDNPEINK